MVGQRDVVGDEDVPSVQVTDAVLAERAGDGEIAAFEMLLARYSDRVFGLCLRMLADRSEAEDAAQDAFVTAWRSIGSLSDPGAVRTWLFRIAHRQCLQVLRTRRSRRTDPVDELPASGPESHPVGGGAPDPASDPQRSAEASEGLRALRSALAALPAAQRAVWLLTEVQGLSYAETAVVVGASEQAVRGRLSRARAALGEAMREWR